MLPSTSKIFLKNTISQVNNHNKIIEERLCWQERKLEKKASKKISRTNNDRSKSEEEIYSAAKKQKLDGNSNNNKDPFYWTKQLYKLENSNNDRWSHDGYKDMHQEQFDEKYKESADVLYGPELPPTEKNRSNNVTLKKRYHRKKYKRQDSDKNDDKQNLQQ